MIVVLLALIAILTFYCVAVKHWLTPTGTFVATLAGALFGYVFMQAL